MVKDVTYLQISQAAFGFGQIKDDLKRPISLRASAAVTVVATIVFVGSLLALVAMGSGGPLADDLAETITVSDPSGILMAVSLISFVGSVVSGGATVYFARKERAAFDKDPTQENNTQES